MSTWRVQIMLVAFAVVAASCSSGPSGASTSGNAAAAPIEVPELMGWTGEPLDEAGEFVRFVDGTATAVSTLEPWPFQVLDEGRLVFEHPARADAFVHAGADGQQTLVRRESDDTLTELFRGEALVTTYDATNDDLLVAEVGRDAVTCFRGAGWNPPVEIAADGFCRLLGNGSLAVTSQTSFALLAADNSPLLEIDDRSVTTTFGRDHVAVVTSSTDLRVYESLTGTLTTAALGLDAPMVTEVLDDGTALFSISADAGSRAARALLADGTIAAFGEGSPSIRSQEGRRPGTVLVTDREASLTTVVEVDLQRVTTHQLATNVDAFTLIDNGPDHLVIEDGEVSWHDSEDVVASVPTDRNRIEFAHGGDGWVLVGANTDGEIGTTDVLLLHRDRPADVLATSSNEVVLLDSEAGGVLLTTVAADTGSALAHVDAAGSTTHLIDPGDGRWLRLGSLSTDGSTVLVTTSGVDGAPNQTELIDIATGASQLLEESFTRLAWVSWWDDQDRDRTSFGLPS